MKRRGKIIATITTMCLAFAMLVVGVLAAQTVSMEIGGTVTYKVEDAMCNFTTSLFCADNNTLVTDAGLYNEMVKLTDTTLDINDESVTLPTNIVRSGRFTTVSKSSYDIQTSTFNSELDVDGLELVLGKYDTGEEEASRKSYSYYIVLEVENLGDNNVEVQVTPDVTNVVGENLRNILINNNITLKARETQRVVIGYALKTLMNSVNRAEFNFIVEAKAIELIVPELELETFHKSSTLQDISLQSETITCTTEAGTLAGGSALVSFSIEDIPEGYNNLQLMISDSANTTYSNDCFGMYVNSEEELPTNLQDAMTLLTPVTQGNLSNAIVASNITNVYLEGEDVYFFIVLSGFDTSLATVDVTIQKTLMALESKTTKGSVVTLEDCFVEMLIGMPMVLVNATLNNIQAESMVIDIPSAMGISGAIMLEEQTHPKSLGQAFSMLMTAETSFASNNGETSVEVPLTSKYADNSLKFAFAVIGMFTEASVDISLTASYGELEAESEYTYELRTINEKQGYVITGYNGSDTNVVVPSYFVDEATNTAYDVIGVGGFGGNIQSVVLPDTLLSISNFAFSGCSKLSSIDIPNKVTTIGSYAFQNCTRLEKITIPNSVISLGSYAFSNTGLTSVTIPNSVISLGSYAFEDCSGLKTVYYKANISEAYASYSNPFENAGATEGFDVVIGEEGGNEISVPDYLFYNNANLKTVEIKNNVIAIGAAAFSGCSGFTGELNIPDSVANIGSSAFSGCSGFTGELNISENVITIGGGAFYSCIGLQEITIPNSVISLGSYAFEDCSGLKTVYYKANISGEAYSDSSNPFKNAGATEGFDVVIGEEGGNEISVPDYLFYNNANLKTVEIKNNVIAIGAAAFSGCSGFTGELNIPDSVANIGSSAFSGCSGFTGELNIPDSVANIGAYAFSGCSGFTGELNIPENVITIGGGAFRGCSGFTGKIKIPNKVDTIEGYTFSNCTGITVVDLANVTSIGYESFKDCSNLTSIEMSNVTSIAVQAFSHCNSLTNIDLPDKVTNIGSNAFAGSGITAITIPSGVTNISNIKNCYNSSKIVQVCNNSELDIALSDLGIDDNVGAEIKKPNQSFSHSLKVGEKYITYQVNSSIYLMGLTNPSKKTTLNDLPNNITAIYYDAFAHCKEITGEVIIPDSVSLIGQNAFYSCTGITGLDLGNVTTIEAFAFWGCSGLTGELIIPGSIGLIYNGVFVGCTGITKLVISANTGSIMEAAFDFSGLESIIVEEGSTLYTSKINGQETNCLIKKYGTDRRLLYGCKNSIIPDTITHILGYSFSGCKEMENIIIPDSVTYIGEYAFSDWSSSQKIYIEGDLDTMTLGRSWSGSATVYEYSENTPTEDGNFWHYVNEVPTVWA